MMNENVKASQSVLVSVRNLKKYFDASPSLLARLIERKPKATLKAVDGVSFDIRRGETLALVGESGCGKSTTARMLVGLYKPTEGSVVIDGKDLFNSKGEDEKLAKGKIQMIFQDPYASLNPRWNVGKIVAEPLRAQKLMRNAKEIDDRVNSVLHLVNLSKEDKAKYPHQFSGGQRQRISIARAIAIHPEFLVCDEPTSALDVSVQAQVLNLMQNLQREVGLTYLFISHNLSVVHHISDRVGVMYLGRLVELTDKRTLFTEPRHPYTRMLLEAIPDMTQMHKKRTPVAGEVPNPLKPPSGCAFHPRCPYATERCKREVPQMKFIDSHGSTAEVACHAVEERRI